MQTDAYQATGCYNLLCSGFVQINNRIAMGAAISPRSSVNGRQFDIGIMIWKVYFFLCSITFNFLTHFFYNLIKEKFLMYFSCFALPHPPKNTYEVRFPFLLGMRIGTF